MGETYGGLRIGFGIGYGGQSDGGANSCGGRVSSVGGGGRGGGFAGISGNGDGLGGVGVSRSNGGLVNGVEEGGG